MKCDDDPAGPCADGIVLYVHSKNDIVYCPLYFTLRRLNSLSRGSTVDAGNLLSGNTLMALLSIVNAGQTLLHECPAAQKLPNRDKLRSNMSYMVSTQTLCTST